MLSKFSHNKASLQAPALPEDDELLEELLELEELELEELELDELELDELELDELLDDELLDEELLLEALELLLEPLEEPPVSSARPPQPVISTAPKAPVRVKRASGRANEIRMGRFLLSMK